MRPPLFCLIICFAACLKHRKTLFESMSCTLVHSASVTGEKLSIDSCALLVDRTTHYRRLREGKVQYLH